MRQRTVVAMLAAVRKEIAAANETHASFTSWIPRSTSMPSGWSSRFSSRATRAMDCVKACASVASKQRKQIRASALRRRERPRIRLCARTRRCSSQAAFSGLGGGDVPNVRQRKKPRHVDRTAGSHPRVVPSRSFHRHHRCRFSVYLLRHFRHQRLIYPNLHPDRSQLHTAFGSKLYRSAGSSESRWLCHWHLSAEPAG